ncbi:MAG: helix-turn-helix domain-containing protein, partial [Clostridium sp.]
TIPVRGEKNRIIGLLCINFYLNTPFSEYIRNFIPATAGEADQSVSRQENFSASSVELLEDMVEQIREEVIEDKEITSANRNKEIIQRLYQKGVYNMKDAVIRTAEMLGISKNTVYMHLRNMEQ